jgi:hypothetical protein
MTFWQTSEAIARPWRGRWIPTPLGQRKAEYQSSSPRASLALPLNLLLLIIGQMLIFNASAQTNCTPAPSGIVSWWPADGFALDVIGTNNATLQNGAAYAPGEVGHAFRLDGVSAYLSVPASSSLNVGLGSGFTIELWIDPANLGNQPLLEWNNGSTYGAHFWIFSSPGQLYANLVDTGGGSHDFYSAAGVLVSNAFQHVALTYNNASGLGTIFRNGVQVAQASLGSFTPQTTYDLYLGFRPAPSGNAPFAGTMDEISIYNRALASNEIAAIYAAGGAGKCFTNTPGPVFVRQPGSQTAYVRNPFALSAAAMGTPRPQYQWLSNGVPLVGATNASLAFSNPTMAESGPYALVASNIFGQATSGVAYVTITNCFTPPAGVIAWWPGNGNALDVIGGHNGALAGGTTYSNGQSGTLAFNFDGADTVVVSNAAALNFAANAPITVEVWAYRTTSGDPMHLVGKRSGCGGSGINYQLAFNEGAGQGLVFGGDYGGISTGVALPLNSWHHLVGTFDGSTTYDFYMDGQQIGSAAGTSLGPEVSDPLLIAGSGTCAEFQGCLQDIRIYSRALGGAEIAALYAAGAAGKCQNSPAFITGQPLPQTVPVGGAATFSVQVAGTPPFGYQWQHNGTNLTDTARVSGSKSNLLTISNVQFSDAGSYMVDVTNILDSTNSQPAALVVTTVAPVLTWNPAPITYGTALGSNQLNATANVPGSNNYSTPVGTMLDAGIHPLSVVFTPSDTLDYNSATDTVSLLVSRAPLTVVAGNAARQYGQPNPVFTGSIAGLRNGDNITATYSCSATLTSSNGTYPIVPTLQDPNGRLGNYQINLINGTLTVTNGPLPDLRVLSVSIPQQAWTGRGFEVAWILTNSGPGTATGPWADALYLSSTNQLRTNQDQLLGYFPFEGQLGPGQSVNLAQTVTINSAGVTNGEYYISVLADATNAISELTKTNNVGVSASNILVQLTPLPVLNVTNVDAPMNAIDGQPVGVSWVVCNVGQADTDVPVWYDHLYLSSNASLAGVVLDLGEYENPDYLIAGDCYEQNVTLTLPIGLSGLYYFIVNADSADLLAGDFGTNHLGSTARPISVQGVTPGYFLTASVQVAPAPPTATWAGQQISCTYIVQNVGQSPITGSWDDRITLSPVSNYVNGVTSGFVYENDIGNSGPLAPGASYTNSAQFTLPQTVSGTNISGTWYVVPVVDIHFAAGGNGFGTGNIGRNELAAPLDITTPPPSDLVVTRVSAPTNAVEGQSMNISWTVVNDGNNVTSSDYWYDGIYLSTNATFNVSESTLIGTYGYFGGLGLTSSYTQNVGVTIPTTLFPASYYLFVVADVGNAVYELNKSNNVLAATNLVTIQPVPPTLLAVLAVTAVSAPWTTIAGSQAYISWTVANQGPGATDASSWVDSVYMSQSTNLNVNTAEFLGSVPHNGVLAAGGSYSQGQFFNIPYCLLGSNYVLVFTDSGAQVNEGGKAANNILAAPQATDIWPGNAARLGISTVSIPTNVLAGSPLTVAWTTGNSGNTTANAPWIDAVYLSPVPEFIPSNGYLLGLYTNGANIAAGESNSATLSATVPHCFSGACYAAVVADVSNVVNGISCDTNNLGSSSVPVQVVPSGYASLQVAGIQLPSSVNSGYPWPVQWTVTNAGPSAATAPWSDALYASLSPSLDSTALLLGQFSYTSSLASGATYTQTQPVTLPSCLSGSYFIYVVADVSNSVNSSACQVNDQARSAGPLTVNEGAYPDLVVNSVAIPATAYAAQPMAVSWTVANTGSATANGPWLDSVYISTSATFNANNSVFLGNYPFTGTLAPGATYSQTTSFTLPDTTHGNFYVFVMTDSGNALNECQGETNKVGGSSSVVNVPVTLYPDLKVTAVQAPASAFAGQSVNVSWVVTNDGTDATPPSAVWNDAVFLSADEVLDPSDTRLGNFASPISLGVGQSYTNSATVQIPPSAAGPYYILVLADSGGSLFEYLGYNDSLGSTPSAMIVSLPPPADLAVMNVTLSPASAVPGNSITIGWNVQNLTSNTIPATWTDNVYLSTNNVWDINAVQVASQNHSGLVPNGSYAASWTGPLPALTPGSYHAIAWTDVRNTAQETNLANNIAVSPNTIAVEVPVLVLGQQVTNQLSTGSAQYYKVNVPAGQTVSVTLTGASSNSFNELFVRYGAIPDLGNYDFLYSSPFSPNQQITIPTTQAGWYYIMVRGGNEPGGPLSFTLEANIVPFAITGISQNHIGDNGQVTITLTGAQFQPGATVELVSGTNAYVSATNFFNNAASIAARFFFTNAMHGIYNVVLTDPNNQSTTATQAVMIETALPLTAQVVPGLVNNYPRVGLPFEWNGAVVNAGNVDIQYLSIVVFLDQPFNFVLIPPSVTILAATNSTENAAAGSDFIARDMPPCETLPFSFVVSAFSSQGLSYYIVPKAEFKQDFFVRIAEEAENLRDYMLAPTTILTQTTTNVAGAVTTNILSVPPELAAVLASSNTWAEFWVSGLATANLLDTNDLASFRLATSASVSPLVSLVPKDSSWQCQACEAAAFAETLVDLAAQATEEVACFYLCTGAVLVQSATIELLIVAQEHLCQCANDCIPQASCSSGGSPCPPGTVWNPCPTYNPSAPVQVCIGACVTPATGNDPNGMQGPSGYSTAAVVGSQIPWQYTIYFENESNALAFARQIAITNVLPPSFDIRTFRVSEIAFGNVTIDVPTNQSFYQIRVAAPYPNPSNIVVDVTAGVDVQHNRIFWTLNAIDLNSGQLVQNANEGVLPPDSPDPIGVGHVTYTIQPLSDMPTGTVITNEASIVFDNNDPINTNPTTNTVDAVPPTSAVMPLPSAELTTNFMVSWFGTDDPNGSGVADYDIYVSDDNGPWQMWQATTSATSATYGGQPGHTYGFYSVAHDNSGNVEPTPAGYQAMTYVSTNQVPVLEPISNQTIVVGANLALTNLFPALNGSTNLTFSLQNAPDGASINPTNGAFAWTPACEQGSTTNLITIWASDSGSTPLSNSVTFAVVVGDCVEVSIGSTVMQIGTTSSVPVNLLSTVAVTNLNFTVSYPSNRFTNWSFSPSNNAIGSFSAGEFDSADAVFSLQTANGQVFQGPALAGSVQFTATSNSSAFVPLIIKNIQGTKTDGFLVGSTVGVEGRVVDIGPQPLLEASMVTNARMLTLYGNPGASYQIAYATNLLITNWVPAWRVPMTNLAEMFPVNQMLSQVFYRAWEFHANPPVLDLNSFTPTNLLLTVYGQKGSNYLLVAGTNLPPPGGWSSVAGFMMTNSFQFIGVGPLTNRTDFFRAERQ